MNVDFPVPGIPLESLEGLKRSLPQVSAWCMSPWLESQEGLKQIVVMASVAMVKRTKSRISRRVETAPPLRCTTAVSWQNRLESQEELKVASGLRGRFGELRRISRRVETTFENMPGSKSSLRILKKLHIHRRKVSAGDT